MAQPRLQLGRVLLIVNPTSGGGRGARVIPVALEAFKRRGISPEVHVSRSGDDAAVLARRLARDALLVAVGGDGHTAAIADGLLSVADSADRPPLAILPAGSANDLARNLGLPVRNVQGAVDVITSGHSRRIDVIRAITHDRDRIFLNVVGAGFDAEVAEAAHRITVMRGAGRYVLAIARVLPRYRASQLRLTIDGKLRTVAAMMVAVANGPAYGGGMRVAPDARFDSGQLDICVVGELSRPAFLRAFPRVFRGTHVTHPAVTMLRARQVTIESEIPLRLTGDGERAGTSPVTLTVIPHALDIISVPPKTHADKRKAKTY